MCSLKVTQIYGRFFNFRAAIYSMAMQPLAAPDSFFPLAAMKNSVVIVFSSLAQIYNTLDRFTILETDMEINKQKSVWAIVKL